MPSNVGRDSYQVRDHTLDQHLFCSPTAGLAVDHHHSTPDSPIQKYV